MVGFWLDARWSLGWPETASSLAPRVDSLFLWIAVVVGVWFLLCELTLIVLLWRARARSRQRSLPIPPRGNEGWWIAALAAAVLACDLAIEAYGHSIWTGAVAGAPRGALPVRVEGRQFAWTVQHPGADEELGTADDVELQNELHVLVGKPVELRLRSVDVIHSFFLPSMRLKQDVVPGLEVRRWFLPTREGTFPLVCAELCGFAHFRMGGHIVVHDPAGYERWLNSATQVQDSVGSADG
ncbi:MAG: hypothetical protein N3C12_15255 [Candidatus Binatia bacterium]|nr:hypothetical protein [Candidatus Binatia bacterium]